MGTWVYLTIILGAATPASADDSPTLKLGRHLARECSTCHRVDGVDSGIPSITGWPADVFIETMGYYRSGTRPNQAMVSVAQSLTDEDIRALALYYGSLAKPKRPR